MRAYKFIPDVNLYRGLGIQPYRDSNFSILNFIAITVPAERMHVENDILRMPRAMISYDTVLATFRAARLV